jgi:hypothetical protein
MKSVWGEWKNYLSFFVKIPLLIKFRFFSGILDKKKGLFNRRRMFLLTEGPHLYYVDSSAMVLKGEIPWNSVLKTEIRDFRIFFVHVPGRIYYLIDQESTSKGQLISKCPFGVFKSPKKTTIFFQDSCPSL